MGQIIIKQSNLKIILLITVIGVFGSNCDLSFSGDETDIFFVEGEFWMGSADNQGQKDEHPRHLVYLDSFTIDKNEVTGKEFESYLEVHPKEHPTITGWYGRKVRPGMSRIPVIGLTWKRCTNYCAWRGKRLPTEAEWEYACRAGTSGSYSYDNTQQSLADVAWYKENSGDLVHAVAGKMPNRWGLFDMHGNLWEWCSDLYSPDYYMESPRTKEVCPSAPFC